MDDRTVKNINIGIVVMCVIAFLPVFKADFVYYDDPEYILGNQFIKKISLANIASIFMGKATLLYVPLTLISYMIEISLFGDKPFSFHFINLALHIVNCLLLFKILQRLNIKNSFIILFILMFFSVSPLVTESVCWATERKDVLYCLFYFLSALRFLVYLASGKTKDIGYSFLFFILACLSKPMAVTLPALLLVYVIYHYGKNHKTHTLKLVPFFAAALLFSALAFYMVNSGKVDKETELHYGFLEKATLIFSALGFYFFKPFMPWNQQVIYLFPSPADLFHRMNIIFYALSTVVLISICIYSILKRGNKRMLSLFTCWLILIVPLLQLDSNNHSYVNERYLYISLIFPAALVFLWLQQFKPSPALLKNGMIVLAILFTLLTFRRSLAWKNTLNLFNEDLKSGADAYALNNLGCYYNNSGNFQKGRSFLLQAIHLDSTKPVFLNNYGWALSELGEMDSAMFYFKKALILDKDYISALNNLGVCYSKKNIKDSSGVVFNHAYKLDPENSESNYYMGVYLNFIGKPQEAGLYFAKARELGNKLALNK